MKRRIALALAAIAVTVGLSACQPGGYLSDPPHFTEPPHFQHHG